MNLSEDELDEAVKRLYASLPERKDGPERPSDEEIDEALEAAAEMLDHDNPPQEGLEEMGDYLTGRK